MSLNLFNVVSHTHICDHGGGLCGAAQAQGRGEERQWPAADSSYLNQKSNQFKPYGNKQLDTVMLKQ